VGRVRGEDAGGKDFHHCDRRMRETECFGECAGILKGSSARGMASKEKAVAIEDYGGEAVRKKAIALTCWGKKIKRNVTKRGKIGRTIAMGRKTVGSWNRREIAKGVKKEESEGGSASL